MGVPAFFRWLSRKYPSIVVQCDDGVKGEYHFDNLYLDMNGIIHPCSHPENKPPPANEDEMFMAIFEYVEDIMQIVKPKKLLYMAVDGVAPRAKMNQQRSRRFRAAQESYEKMIEVQKVKDSLKERGIDIKEKEKVEHFDSNVITPGTDFMVNLSEALRSWINRRLSDDFVDKHGIWPKDLVIILSDASVPGEGEHKIMDYIRKQKADSLYNPNLSHCLYGADADLIMLGLATHEPNFTILREEFKPNQPKPCDLCGQLGHELKDCTGEEKAPEDLPIPLKTDFIYIRLNVLREYLEKESQNCSVKLDFERFIDDYVFLCFFVGNDFLPHLPSLEIRENAIDRLINIYKYVLETVSDSHDLYLTKDGIVNKPRAQCVLKELGEVEDEIFKLRQRNEKSFRERNKRRKLMRMNEDLKWLNPQAVSAYQKPEAFKNAKEEASKVRMTYNAGTGQANERLNSMLVDKNAGSSGSSAAQNNSAQQQKGTKRSLDADSDSEPEDLVQLHTEGWKERYYMHKFDCNSVPEISRLVANEYFKGLCWVLLYYYQGCPDWKWFFPYHYAPFASDFHDVEKLPIEFDGSAKPFRPMEQLMSVFPAASSKNLPPSWRLLMTTNSSPIIDFYPTSFRIDLNGKKAAWMGVALLPFIDEDRLFRALSTVYDQLTESEKLRNSLGAHLIFVSKHHPLLTAAIQDVINSDKSDEPIPQGENAFKLMAGKLSKSALYSTAYKNLMCCEFSDPQYEPGFIYPAKLLANAKIPDQVLRPNDISQFDNYRPQIGMNRRQNQAYLDRSGHRTVERSVQREYQGGRERTSWHNQYGYDQNPNYRQGGGGNRYPQNGANRGGAGSGGGYRGSYSNYNDRRSGQGGGGGGGGSRNNYQSSNRDPRAQGSYQQQPSSNYASHSYYQSNHNYYQQQSYGQPQSYGQHSYGQAYQQHQQYGSRVQYPQAPPAQPAAISSYYSSDYAANPPQQPPVGNNGGQSGIYRGGSSSSDKYRQQNYKRY